MNNVWGLPQNGLYGNDYLKQMGFNPMAQQPTQQSQGMKQSFSEIPVVNKIMQKAATPAPKPMSDIPSVDQTLQKAQKMGGMSFMSQPNAYRN